VRHLTYQYTTCTNYCQQARQHAISAEATVYSPPGKSQRTLLSWSPVSGVLRLEGSHYRAPGRTQTSSSGIKSGMSMFNFSPSPSTHRTIHMLSDPRRGMHPEIHNFAEIVSANGCRHHTPSQPPERCNECSSRTIHHTPSTLGSTKSANRKPDKLI